MIAASADPGRLGRSAYHFVHPVMVAGIIVTAAADELVVSRPDAAASAQASWMILGGAGLFIAGHAAFKAIIWRRLSWPRIAALAILALLGLLAPHVSALALSVCSAVLIVALVLADSAGLGAPAGGSSGSSADGSAGVPADAA